MSVAPTAAESLYQRPPEQLPGDARLLSGNQYLGLYRANSPNSKVAWRPVFNDPPSWFKAEPSPWYFAHRSTAKAAIHSIAVREDATKDGNDPERYMVSMFVTKRPPFGEHRTLELPGGIVGDKNPNEHPLLAADREIWEETGYKVEESAMLAPNLFATSPGMTTEQKYFTVARLSGQPCEEGREPAERVILEERIEIPLKHFLDNERFSQWLQQQAKEGRYVGMDVIAARGLVSPQALQGVGINLQA